jgi:hypothetical protein
MSKRSRAQSPPNSSSLPVDGGCCCKEEVGEEEGAYQIVKGRILVKKNE